MKYYLAESCQNTFIIFDHLNEKTLTPEFLEISHSFLKKENRDDALILMHAEKNDDSLFVEMVVLGQDKVIAEFCGNGARAISAYLHKNYPDYKNYYLKTKKGHIKLLKHAGDLYSVMLPPASLNWNKKFVTKPSLLNQKYTFNYAETGTSEPHLIIKNCLSDQELQFLGEELNQNKNLFPFGINVNCWHPIGEDEIHVKTYERGVQRLTKSCGTGSIACAAYFQGFGTVLVSNPGGNLKISFSEDKVELYGKSTIEKEVEL